MTDQEFVPANFDNTAFYEANIEARLRAITDECSEAGVALTWFATTSRTLEEVKDEDGEATGVQCSGQTHSGGCNVKHHNADLMLLSLFHRVVSSEVSSNDLAVLMDALYQCMNRTSQILRETAHGVSFYATS